MVDAAAAGTPAMLCYAILAVLAALSGIRIPLGYAKRECRAEHRRGHTRLVKREWT
jgi:hypothetical protein